MAYRSWLRDVKNIHELGDHASGLKYRGNQDDARELRYEAKFSELIRRPVPVAEAYRPHFGSNMHDSSLLGIHYADREVRVKLTSLHAEWFFEGIQVILGIDLPDQTWPVNLICRDVCYANAARYGPGGGLRWSSWQDLPTGTLPGSRVDFLYDWFFEQQNRLQWIARIHAPIAPRGKLSWEIVLMVDCQEVVACDFNETTFAKMFSPSVSQIYRDCLFGPDNAEPGWSPWNLVGKYDEFIRSQMEARHLSASDLLPSP